MRLLITAIRTLTILPVPGRDARRFADAVPLFPVVGVLIATLMWCVCQIGSVIIDVDHHLLALALVAFGTIITGALHIDGLADVADAFGGGRTKERVLEILKDSRHGTFGVCAIVLVLLGKYVLYEGFISNGTFLPIALGVITARSVQAVALAWIPNARGEGSVAAVFSGGVSHKIAVLVMLAGVAAVVAVVPGGGWRGVIAVGVAVGCATLFVLWSMRRIGGITGDCLGVVNEIAEVGVMVVYYAYR